MNSLYQQLNQPKTDSLITMFKQSRDPQGLLMNLMACNPQVSAVVKEIQANGGDARSLFYKKANDMGIDPNVILNMLK